MQEDVDIEYVSAPLELELESAVGEGNGGTAFTEEFAAILERFGTVEELLGKRNGSAEDADDDDGAGAAVDTEEDKHAEGAGEGDQDSDGLCLPAVDILPLTGIGKNQTCTQWPPILALLQKRMVKTSSPSGSGSWPIR